MNKQSNTKFSMIMLLVFLSTLLAVIAAPIITLEKTEYELGENIEIYLNISDTGNLTIDLVTPSYLFKYLSPNFKIPYRPTELGLHTINLYQDFNLVETESFEVISDIPTLDYLWLEKADFDFNEVVIIYFNESLLQPSYKLRILSKS